MGPSPQVKLFGNPFLIHVAVDERLADIKARIQAKLGTKPEDFDTWRWSWHSTLSSPQELTDDDETLESHLKGNTGGGLYCDFLGVEHTDTAPRRKYRRQDSSRCGTAV